MSLLELLNVTSTLPQQLKVQGMVTGIVEDIKDPLNQGRVKVNFPWLAESADTVTISQEADEDRAHSYWARMSTLMAGPGRGTWFIPEVGDEVLVAFEYGVLDRPFVLGVLWNSEDAPPDSMDSEGDNNLRVIHSRCGHRIVLDDTEDAPRILIVDKTEANSILINSADNSMTISVDGDLTINVGGNLNISVQGKISVDAAQDITAETQANLKLKAIGQGSLESTGPLKLKSDAQLAADGTGQAELKAAMVTVNGTGMAELKGGLVKIN
jgi:uncharacterized protein involved in type VI secretion and phage assembly